MTVVLQPATSGAVRAALSTQQPSISVQKLVRKRLVRGRHRRATTVAGGGGRAASRAAADLRRQRLDPSQTLDAHYP
jgi:hypothetical protein